MTRKQLLASAGGVAGGVLAVALGLLLLTSTNEPPPPAPRPLRLQASGPPPPPPPVLVTVVDTPPAEAPAPPPPPPRVDPRILQKLEQETQTLFEQMQVAGIVAEYLRLRGRTAEHGRVLDEMRRWDNWIEEGLAKLRDLGKRLTLPPRVAVGEWIVGLGYTDFSRLRPADVAFHLENWIRSYRPGTLEQVVVMRGAERVQLTFSVPIKSPALAALAQTAGVVLGSETAPAAVPPIILDLRAAFRSLPPGYERCLPMADGMKLEALSQKVLPDEEEIEFVRSRILGELVAHFRKEHAQVEAELRELQPRLGELRTDFVYLRNGGRLDGQLQEDDEKHYRLLTHPGTLKLPKANVLRVEKGKAPGATFPGRLEAARGNLEALAVLAKWCGDNRMPLQKRAVALLMLTVDASDARARQETGYGLPAAPTPPPGAPPPPVFRDESVQQAVVKAVEQIAGEVVSSHRSIFDVIGEMKRRTEHIKYDPPSPLIPDKYSEICRFVKDPVAFEPRFLNRPQSEAMAQWWAGMNHAERKDFARFYGLWCASRLIRK